MELYDKVEWSNLNLTLRQFVDHYSHKLPQIVLVTEGYSGRDDETHQIGVDEIFWVHDILGQSRVLLKDSHGRCNSIPLDDISLFQLLKKDGHKTGDLPLQEALRQYRHNEDFIQFSENAKVVISAGAECSHTRRLGLMTKLDEYDQKYLLVHDIYQAEVMPQRTAVPLYVPITVEVALNFKSPSKLTFQDYMEEKACIVSKFKGTRTRLNSGILQFDKEPEGDYAYIEPLVRLEEGEADSQKKEDPSPNVYEEIVYNLYAVIDESKKTPSPKISRRSQSLATEPATPPRPPARSHSMAAASPKQQLKAAATPQEATADHVPIITNLSTPAMEIAAAFMQQTVTDPSSPDSPVSERTPANPSPPQHSHPAAQQRTASDALSKLKQNINRSNDTSFSVSSSFDDESESCEDLAEPCYWKSGADIPTNIKDFTVDQVRHALQLLKLENVASLVSTHCVDGNLLTQLDENILIEDFNCKRIEARKIDRFIKGWRPKE